MFLTLASPSVAETNIPDIDKVCIELDTVQTVISFSIE